MTWRCASKPRLCCLKRRKLDMARLPWSKMKSLSSLQVCCHIVIAEHMRHALHGRLVLGWLKYLDEQKADSLSTREDAELVVRNSASHRDSGIWTHGPHYFRSLLQMYN